MPVLRNHTKKTKAFSLLLLCLLILFAAGCSNDAPDADSDAPDTSAPLGGGYAQLIHSEAALEIFREGTIATVRDVETGITYQVRRAIGGFNTLADVETLTPEDTERLLETAGGDWNIRRRAVIVYIGDYRIAASITPFQHLGCENSPFGEIVDNRSGSTGTGINLNYIQGNGMIGVVDIYFWNSLMPGINRPCERHQEMVLRAYQYEG